MRAKFYLTHISIKKHFCSSPNIRFSTTGTMGAALSPRSPAASASNLGKIEGLANAEGMYTRGIGQQHEASLNKI